MSRIKTFISILAVSVALSACSTDNDLFITHNGNMPTNERIAQVQEGQTKNEVLNILGAPSSVVSLDKDTWIYMSSDIKRVAFFKPEEVSRDILTLKFDGNKLAEIKRTGKNEGQEVVVAEEETETLGHKRGFFERFFGGTQTYAPMGGGSAERL